MYWFHLPPLIFAALVGLNACFHTATPDAANSFRDWDTSFSIAGVSFPNAAMLRNAVPQAGDSGRLAWFFSKCASRDTVRLGFIGGSITAGALATAEDRRYSTTLLRFLRRAFPRTAFVEINAGIGATNSRFGCSRLEEDVLGWGPDLVVVEFAVNDVDMDTAISKQTVEGLVRRTLLQTDAAVLLLHMIGRFDDGRYSDTVPHRFQNALAQWYGLPVVSYFRAIEPVLSSGSFVWSDLSADMVHPNDQGHLLCGYLLYRFLAGFFAGSQPGPRPMPMVPVPLYSRAYESAGILHAGDPVFSVQPGGWVSVPGERGRQGFRSLRKGDSLVLDTPAREITLAYWYADTLHARVEMALDGQIPDTVSNYFQNNVNFGYMRLQQAYAEETSQAHRLVLRNLTDSLFDLQYVLYAP